MSSFKSAVLSLRFPNRSRTLQRNEVIPSLNDTDDDSHAYDSVYFEGGLGSQLLTFFELKYRTSRKEKLFVDSSYFEMNAKVEKKSGPDHWSYRLDRYGINLEELFTHSIKPPKNAKRRMRTPPAFDERYWRYSKINMPKYFPIDEDSVQRILKELGILGVHEYTVIHIRRGDYLRVASKIVTDEEYLEFLTKCATFLPKTAIILSDGVVSNATKKKFQQIGQEHHMEFYYLENSAHDECDLHDLMRSSRVLVTSNSTFSLSAAILAGPQNISFSPIDFYNPDRFESLNRIMQKSGNFFLIS